MIKQESIERIIEAIKQTGSNHPSQSKQAASLGISASQLSRILNGDTERVLSPQKWVSIARLLNVTLNPALEWKLAATPTFQFITAQLEQCQRLSMAGLFCDVADLGKTETARHYQRNNANVVYVDCAQVKTKQRLVRYIASQFGVDANGRYADVYADLVYYINSLNAPLIILDEAGDLVYEAFLELKALWNATEGRCGWYMLGADGLREKIRRSIDFKKVGYAELFRRFGSRYQQITPSGSEERKQFIITQMQMVAQVNGSKETAAQLYARTQGSLTRVKIEIQKAA